jgi:hypothetical protein
MALPRIAGTAYVGHAGVSNTRPWARSLRAHLKVTVSQGGLCACLIGRDSFVFVRQVPCDD